MTNLRAFDSQILITTEHCCVIGEMDVHDANMPDKKLKYIYIN